ncbi:MAG: hypothetical protein L0220_24455 [Acidobacteria bacterium]|nr:hypothetical protein [Acidobacteriota bacterium]
MDEVFIGGSMQNVSKQVRQFGFEADYQHEYSKNTHSIGKLYVDKFGRERQESYILYNSEWKLIFIDIWDTVDLKAFLLNAEDKTILDQETLDMRSFEHKLDVGIPDVFTLAIPRHSLYKGEDLGTKQIENLACTGSRRSFRGSKSIPDGEIECWYSDAISYLVFAKARYGDAEIVFRLSNIRLVEPNKELFVVPADYKQSKRH